MKLKAPVILMHSEYIQIRTALYYAISDNKLKLEMNRINKKLPDNYRKKLEDEIKESEKIIQELERIFEN